MNRKVCTMLYICMVQFVDEITDIKCIEEGIKPLPDFDGRSPWIPALLYVFLICVTIPPTNT